MMKSTYSGEGDGVVGWVDESLALAAERTSYNGQRLDLASDEARAAALAVLFRRRYPMQTAEQSINACCMVVVEAIAERIGQTIDIGAEHFSVRKNKR